jgi:hypothetical protein
MLPETTVSLALKQELDALAARFTSIEDAEAAALTEDLTESLRDDKRWKAFCSVVNSTIRRYGYIVVRGIEADEGRSLLIVSAALGLPFDVYRSRRIVKRFRMSPWTEELSHTLRAGDFHTDGNVSTTPPFSTAMQCEQEDPGAPDYAEQRVAYLPRLLKRLSSGDDEEVEAFTFLTEAETTMAHERTSEMWHGQLVQEGAIRYHPHSLRVANRRLGEPCAKLESVIASIHRAAVDVSVPFHTRPGDTVLVSNRTALHYRGACSVRFLRFPTEFESRSLFVLHLKEPVS